jgi:hypothetical protein
MFFCIALPRQRRYLCPLRWKWMMTLTARLNTEKLLAGTPIAPPCFSRSGNSRQLNSPVIPDGWVMVPEEPIHEMLELVMNNSEPTMCIADDSKHHRSGR